MCCLILFYFVKESFQAARRYDKNIVHMEKKKKKVDIYSPERGTELQRSSMSKQILMVSWITGT